jgi:hypothetical protein
VIFRTEVCGLGLCRRLTTLLVAVIAFASWAPFAFAQEPELTADETAKALANPAGSLASLANNLTYRAFTGDLPGLGSQSVWSYTFQPVLPFPVGDKGRNFIVRPAFTASFDQPVYDVATGSFQTLGTNFNDITFDAVYAGNIMKEDGHGYLWGAGLAGTLPTATDPALGGEQWRFGPELFGGVLPTWGLFGALVNNQWNVNGGDGGAGSNDQPYNTTTAQYFYGITLGEGWQILSAPVIIYDWEADSDQALSLPLGSGIAKTKKFGNTNWRTQVEIWYYAKQPDAFGNEWMVSLEIRPVIKNPLIR